ncbi:uncharacterized protein LOC131841228 [Achroia grisella]|uniref:uncharacterized protein LOC131841228 n=1 Tax=Achroia grisella TaxID=688607 RepID=UPI0027D2EB6F|nr:uncharacterized protein LOC131841228 [Achroia grisella]
MKNVSSVQSKNLSESPKTPGGISKSLLTPCRRVGLSRNWRKGGVSPFVSPLTTVLIDDSLNKIDNRPQKDTRKRKARDSEELQDTDFTQHIIETNKATEHSNNVNKTPSRRINLQRHKRSKTILSGLTCNTDSDSDFELKSKDILENSEIVKDMTQREELGNLNIQIGNKTLEATCSENSVCIDSVSKYMPSSIGTLSKQEMMESQCNENCVDPKRIINIAHETNMNCKKSPENLIKECTIVIQKKIFKHDVKKYREANSTSQNLFDSDSDDVPLSNFYKDMIMQKKVQTKALNLEDDFMETNKVIAKRCENKKLNIGNVKKLMIKNKSKENTKNCRTQKSKKQQDDAPSSQSSYNDDDDFEVNNKRTILIKKTYEKASKPIKAKSTGSITQKDIDELKSRIEIKKKLLLAKATGNDTKELRDLVKKWQKGCQNALMELMELMRTKVSDKPNMEYSDMLQMLKIPATLVGYDSDNDCFVTPDDSAIILSKFNN